MIANLEAGLLNDLETHLLKQPIHLHELGEAFVLRLAVVVAVVNLLNDARQAEQPVGVLKVVIVDLNPRAFGVVINELAAGQHAGRIARLAAHQLYGSGVIGFNPVGERVAQVH